MCGRDSWGPGSPRTGGRKSGEVGRPSSEVPACLADGHDRLPNEARGEQRRLPEIPCGAHLIQIHPDQVRGEHPDDLLDLQGCEPKRLRIADGRSEGRIDAVDVDREVDLVAVDRLQRTVHRGTDASLVDVEDAHIRQTESFEVLPFLPTVRTHADVD